MSGFGKIGGFDGTVGYIASAGLPMPSVVAVLTILIELGGGLLLVVGLLTRPAALAIAVFTLLAAFLFHAYWSVPEAARMGQYLSFWKNISLPAACWCSRRSAPAPSASTPSASASGRPPRLRPRRH